MAPSADTPLHDDYDHLTPDLVIQAIESLGYLSDARILALNSYENRVYQVGIDEQIPVIAKFYRPNRWSDAQIQEEHDFARTLEQLDLPVIPPILSPHDQQTLHRFGGYRFAVYQRMGGQAPEPGDFDQLFRLGRLIGRIHAAGRERAFEHRPVLSVETYCVAPGRFLLEQDFIPPHLTGRFETLVKAVGQKVSAIQADVDQLKIIRTHGDCHVGNILWNRDSGPWFVDFDDCLMAPAILDLWMLLAGDRPSQTRQLSEILEGYEEFCPFNRAEIPLIEGLRSLRMIHYAGWLAKRWDDPAFPKNFPWFNSANYWDNFMMEMEEQLMIMEEPPITLY
ncbi:MAG: serine/threonine protein kinase [Ketobacteraceae bacterium]|nr:serine/threonine protein kinase [Ketobacteraceae bacterium]